MTTDRDITGSTHPSLKITLDDASGDIRCVTTVEIDTVYSPALSTRLEEISRLHRERVREAARARVVEQANTEHKGD